MHWNMIRLIICSWFKHFSKNYKTLFICEDFWNCCCGKILELFVI